MSASRDHVDHAFPPERFDSYQLNRIVRHRLLNLAAGVKMAMTRIEEVTTAAFPELGDTCVMVKDEITDIERFTRRLSLICDHMPPPEPMPFMIILANARDQFRRRFPFVELVFRGIEVAVDIDAGNWLALALEELLINAGEATSSDSVTVTWHQSPVLTIIVENQSGEFADTIPLSPPRPFFTSRSRHDGLGLAIVQRMCYGLHAELSIETGPPVRVTVSLNEHEGTDE